MVLFYPPIKMEEEDGWHAGGKFVNPEVVSAVRALAEMVGYDKFARDKNVRSFGFACSLPMRSRDVHDWMCTDCRTAAIAGS